MEICSFSLLVDKTNKGQAQVEVAVVQQEAEELHHVLLILQ